MKEEVRNFDYEEGNLRDRFLRAEGLWGKNPGKDPEFEFNGGLNLESLQNVYKGLKARIAQSAGREPLDWSDVDSVKSSGEKELGITKLGTTDKLGTMERPI